jgi:hypothetical protein
LFIPLQLHRAVAMSPPSSASCANGKATAVKPAIALIARHFFLPLYVLKSCSQENHGQ